MDSELVGCQEMVVLLEVEMLCHLESRYQMDSDYRIRQRRTLVFRRNLESIWLALEGDGWTE